MITNLTRKEISNYKDELKQALIKKQNDKFDILCMEIDSKLKSRKASIEDVFSCFEFIVELSENLILKMKGVKAFIPILKVLQENLYILIKVTQFEPQFFKKILFLKPNLNIEQRKRLLTKALNKVSHFTTRGMEFKNPILQRYRDIIDSIIDYYYDTPTENEKDNNIYNNTLDSFILQGKIATCKTLLGFVPKLICSITYPEKRPFVFTLIYRRQFDYLKKLYNNPKLKQHIDLKNDIKKCPEKYDVVKFISSLKELSDPQPFLEALYEFEIFFTSINPDNNISASKKTEVLIQSSATHTTTTQTTTTITLSASHPATSPAQILSALSDHSIDTNQENNYNNNNDTIMGLFPEITSNITPFTFNELINSYRWKIFVEKLDLMDDEENLLRSLIDMYHKRDDQPIHNFFIELKEELLVSNTRILLFKKYYYFDYRLMTEHRHCLNHKYFKNIILSNQRNIYAPYINSEPVFEEKKQLEGILNSIVELLFVSETNWNELANSSNDESDLNNNNENKKDDKNKRKIKLITHDKTNIDMQVDFRKDECNSDNKEFELDEFNPKEINNDNFNNQNKKMRRDGSFFQSSSREAENQTINPVPENSINDNGFFFDLNEPLPYIPSP